VRAEPPEDTAAAAVSEVGHVNAASLKLELVGAGLGDAVGAGVAVGTTVGPDDDPPPPHADTSAATAPKARKRWTGLVDGTYCRTKSRIFMLYRDYLTRT